MNYAPAQQINTARHIARSAQRLIKDKTGMKVSLLLEPIDYTFKTPLKMLEIIAIALDMSPDCYRMRSRLRDIHELRMIGALFLRRHFHSITLKQIGDLFGGKDHSTILGGIARAYNLIHTGDARFMKKYYKALKAVGIWLRKDND